jgi:hypothetical protein
MVVSRKGTRISAATPVLRKNISRHYATLWVLHLLAGSAAGFYPSGI